MYLSFNISPLTPWALFCSNYNRPNLLIGSTLDHIGVDKFREREAANLFSQPVVGPGRRDFESCPRSVTESRRYLSRRNDEPEKDFLRVEFLPGFLVRGWLWGVFGDPYVRPVVLGRRKKLLCAPALERGTAPSTTTQYTKCGIWMPPTA